MQIPAEQSRPYVVKHPSVELHSPPYETLASEAYNFYFINYTFYCSEVEYLPH